MPLQPGRERPLGLAVAVDVRGVDERAARLEEAVEHPLRLLLRRLAAHQHRAEGEAADCQRAELGRLHPANVPCRPCRRSAACASTRAPTAARAPTTPPRPSGWRA